MMKLSEGAQALLQEARAASLPPPGAKARVLAEVRAAAGLPPSATVVAVEASLRQTGAGWGWTVGGGASGLVSLVALVSVIGVNGEPAQRPLPDALVVRPTEPSHEVRFLPPSVAEPDRALVRRASPQAAQPQVPPTAPVKVEPLAQEPNGFEPAAVEPPAAPSKVDGFLAEEARLLGQARIAIREGRLDAALDWVETHAERFPDGMLVQDREGARGVLHCRLGHLEEAERIRAQLKARWPTSVQLSRIDAACGIPRR